LPDAFEDPDSKLEERLDGVSDVGVEGLRESVEVELVMG
jgi:hypothetical protein